MPRGTCPPETELNGYTVSAFIESINHQNFKPILEKYGFADGIDREQWYPLQDVLATLTEIAEHPGAMFNLVSIGMAAADLSPISPEMEKLSIGEFMVLYGKVFPDRHRNGDAGTITTEQLGEKHVKLTLDVYYPDDLMYGVLYGFARRFLSEEGGYTVKYDENHVRKDKGGYTTIIHVMWD